MDQNLNVKLGTMKFLQENIGQALRSFSVGNNFLDRIPKAQETNGIISNAELLHSEGNNQQN